MLLLGIAARPLSFLALSAPIGPSPTSVIYEQSVLVKVLRSPIETAVHRAKPLRNRLVAS